MDKTKSPGCNSNDGFNTLICQEESHDEQIAYPYSNLDNQKVPMYNLTPWRWSRQATVILVVLAVVLLIVDISLGAHYNRLTNDIQHISNERKQVRDINKTAIEILKKQLKTELNDQTKIKWQLDHQTRRKADNLAQIAKITKEIASMKSHLPMISNGCRHCSPGWILLNSVCYYFSFSDTNGLKTWQKAREYCQIHGGDLAILNSQDKENATVSFLLKKHDPSKDPIAFWIGLSDKKDEGTWKWVDGTILTEGYWKEGEPNDVNNEDCASVYAIENFFQAWNDDKCAASNKWICEKAPSLN